MTVLHGLPPQCWSSSYPSSQGCSASWTTSTSATPLWRRRWPWPPSCRTCNPSQVSRQHAAQSFSGTLSNSLGPAGRRKPKPHSMAIKLSSWSNQHPHPLKLSPPPPWLCSLSSSTPSPLQTHTTHMPHTLMYTPLPHSHTHNMPSHRLHTVRNTSHTQHAPHAPSHATHSLITYTQHICTTLTHTLTDISHTHHTLPALRCTLTHSPLALWVVYLPLHLHSGPLSLPTTSLPHCVLSSKASSSAPAFPQPQVSP